MSMRKAYPRTPQAAPPQGWPLATPVPEGRLAVAVVLGASLAGLAAAEREALIKRDDVIGLYEEIVAGINRELSQYERIKRFALLPKEFSIESGELTPTLKVKRKVVEEKWAAVIEELYAAN